MHIHHNPATSANSGTHSSGAAEKAAAAQRAAETRRKLLKDAAQIDASLDASQRFMIRGWPENHSDQGQNPSQHPPQDNQPEGEAAGTAPISVWA